MFMFECEECKKMTCMSCMYNAIFRSAIPEAHCPNCNVLLSNKALRDIFPENKYIQYYIPRLAKAFLELERQKLPFVMKYYKILKVIKSTDGETGEKKGELLKLYRQFQSQIDALKRLLESKDIPAHTLNLRNIRTFDLDSAMQIIGTKDAADIGKALKGVSLPKFINEIVPSNIAKMEAVATDLGMTIDFVVSTIDTTWYERTIQYAVAEYNGDDDAPKEKDTNNFFYVYPCPKENCNGFINLKYHCEVCDATYCSKCLAEVVPNKEHQCKKEDMDSYEEIKRSTKPCPKCATRIFRSQGCAEMFCTKCHTGFDWNTGKIKTGNFHNPHRMEWLRQIAQGTIVGEFNVCQGDTPPAFVGCKVIQYYNGQVNHVRDVVNNYRHQLETLNITRMTPISLKRLIEYISGKCDDKKMLEKYEKICIHQKKLQQIIPVLDEFVDSMTATLNSLYQSIVIPTTSQTDDDNAADSQYKAFVKNMYITILELVDAKSRITCSTVLANIRRRMPSKLCTSIQDLCKKQYILLYKNNGIPFAKRTKEVFEMYIGIINSILGHINSELMMWSITFHKQICKIYSYGTYAPYGNRYENINMN